mmetsp:Transcript_20646/g.55268  ORF Transcript_20646/g.55268 Transcript_20646/m.55268 type:complete len:101 (-) Transcript_20646:1777-2079(-)
MACIMCHSGADETASPQLSKTGLFRRWPFGLACKTSDCQRTMARDPSKNDGKSCMALNGDPPPLCHEREVRPSHLLAARTGLHLPKQRLRVRPSGMACKP